MSCICVLDQLKKKKKGLKDAVYVRFKTRGKLPIILGIVGYSAFFMEVSLWEFFFGKSISAE